MEQEDDRLTHYSTAWELGGVAPLAETATSRLFRASAPGGDCVLKLLKPVGIADEGAAAGLLAHWDGAGAVKLLRHGEDALLLEYIYGPELAETLPEHDDEATQIIAQVIAALHANRKTPPPDGLTPLRTRFRSLFDRAWREPATIYGHGAEVAERLLNTAAPPVTLHGDIHHMNILHHRERGWLAIDPKGLWGDPVFDAANTLCNPCHMPELVTNRERLQRQARIMAECAGYDETRLLEYVFAYACLSASWSLEDEEDPALALKVTDVVKDCLEG